MGVRWLYWRGQMAAILFLITAALALATQVVNAQATDTTDPGFLITGQLIDGQNQPVAEAEVHLAGHDGSDHDSQASPGGESQEDGSWTLLLPALPATDGTVVISRPHFQELRIPLNQEIIDQLSEAGSYDAGTLTLARRISPGFWAAALIFIAVLLLIAFEVLHSTTAALAGASTVFVVTFLSQAFGIDWYILDFERALDYINWEVIFLVMAMMIVIAVIERTGIFQWTAFQAYRLSRGHSWLLVLILMAVTVVASALLDNFTTMLLMAPISIQIGLALGINPLALIIPEVMASNVGGITTLIGTPTNILIGAYADIGFNDFLVHQTVGVMAALIVMAGFVLFYYRREWRRVSGGISPTLYARLEQNAEIEDPSALWKSGLVFLLILAGFIVGERYHVVPAVPALIGSTLLLIWLKPDIQSMIKSVDWTTLVFFMALFMVVGAIQEVGLISIVADAIGRVVGDSLVMAIFLLVFGAGTLSTAIANIPLAASLLPVAEFLTGTIPGANNKALYYALSMGAAMGGNGFLVGAEANLVTAGITEQAGSPISFKEFLKIGLPVTYLTLTVGFLWLYLHFVVWGG